MISSWYRSRMSSRGFLALLVSASLFLAPLSVTFAEDVPPEETAETQSLPIPQEEIQGDITAPTVLQARVLHYPHPEERSSGPRNEIESGLTIVHIQVSDEMNESAAVTVDFSALGGDASVSPNEGISSLFDKYFLYSGPTIAVPDGTYALPYKVSDPNGNFVEGSVSITVDETPPMVENLSVSFDSQSEIGTTILTGTITEAGSPTDLNMSALVYEYDDAGERTYFVPTEIHAESVPGNTAVSSGAFSIEFSLYDNLLGRTFFPNTTQFEIVVVVSDGADLSHSVTSPRVQTSATPPPVSTVSNVLFLPGIKGSRLYRPVDTCDQDLSLSCLGVKLWEPSGNVLIKQLFLNSVGASSNSDVYVKEEDILNEVLGKNFYASFVNQMDALASDGTISAWKAIAYDWRLSLDDIVSKGVRHGDKIYFAEETETPYIEQSLYELASSSPTGKVTIIAHSNGGLVTKRLMQRLESKGEAGLVEKIIFVGVPQTGAPQAMAGLLYGYKEALPFDACAGFPALRIFCSLFGSRDIARELAEHSPMAYHLLPSERYFSDVGDPEHLPAVFRAQTQYAEERARYGESVNSANELYDFLAARDGGRTKPDVEDTKSANVLSSSFLDYGKTIHDSIDSWVPPQSVQVYQVAGWGINTVAGVEYYEQEKLLGGTKEMYRPIFVEDGDGVVPVPSALMLSESLGNVKNYWVNLREVLSSEHILRDHGELFELDELRVLLRNLLLDSTEVIPNFISLEKPSSASDSKLIFYLHSPLTLELYSESNEHLGKGPEGEFDFEIPGAEYGEFGDVKYVIASKDNYLLKMRGEAHGTFSIDVMEVSGNSIISTFTIADVPTTENTVATIPISKVLGNELKLELDENGDEIIDFEISAVSDSLSFYETESIEEIQPIPKSVKTKKSLTFGETMETILTAPQFSMPVKKLVDGVNEISNANETSKTDKFFEEIITTEQHGVREIKLTASAYDAINLDIINFVRNLLYNLWQSIIQFFINVLE